ncbi:MAG: hypothetical protein K2O06_05845 [Acetatifactor sp.]|nr:hypothetical protein [Acetatifactor sp.]
MEGEPMKFFPTPESDLTIAQLPHTRREIFADICGLYGGSLFRTGLILLAFALPLLFLGFLADQNELAYLSFAREAADGERAAIYQEYQLTDSLFSFSGIIGYMIFAAGLSGAARVIRQHSWEEPVNLKIDLLKGIRQNVKSYLLMGFLTGCWIFLSRYCFAGALYAQGSRVLVNLLPLLGGLIILLPVLGFSLVTNAVYSNPFGQNLRMSLLLYLKRPLSSLGIGILMVLLLLLANAVPSIPIRMLLRIMNIFAAPFLLLAWFLWCSSQLDRFINPKYYPELVGKGLVKENTEESGE